MAEPLIIGHLPLYKGLAIDHRLAVAYRIELVWSHRCGIVGDGDLQHGFSLEEGELKATCQIVRTHHQVDRGLFSQTVIASGRVALFLALALALALGRGIYLWLRHVM